jgi:hypothetical protein
MGRIMRFLIRFIALLALAIAGGWLAWKHTPPFSPGVHSVEAAVAATGPTIAGCAVFPPDNIWNAPIDMLPQDTRSVAYIASIGGSQPLHPDFGSNAFGGIPYTEVPPGTKPVRISFGYDDDSDHGDYPIPPDAPIEGGPQSRGDRHVLLVDPHRCMLYEIFSAEPQPDGSWQTGSGVRWPLASNRLRPDGLGSADAAGLPIFPGLVRYDEVAGGEIRHALRFTIPRTQAAYVWPARHKASHITDANVAPMGERFRLRADFDISGFSKTNQIILTALKRYGMFLADNGGSMFLSGAPDKRWDDEDLHRLTRVKAEDFEAVDERGLMVNRNSAQARPIPR